MGNFRSLLGIKRIDIILNEHFRELCGMKNGMVEGIDKNVLRWFEQIERMENSGSAKRV